MKHALFGLVGLTLATACHGGGSPQTADAGDDVAIDAAPIDDLLLDAPPLDEAATGFGTLGGADCGHITDDDLAATNNPKLYQMLSFEFARAYVDPDDRPLLTPGGMHMAATPNLGGSSGISEVFAFEELARCEGATLIHTEAEIAYDTQSKRTDLEILIHGQKIGVSVTRAFAFPLGTAYTLAQAKTLIHKKLTDIPLSSASVSAADRWVKQFLAIEAIDQQSSDTMAQAWAEEDAAAKSDTIVILVTTNGTDQFIYQNQ